MMDDLKERLRARNVRKLPGGWKKGRKCPECNSSAERQKCMWDMGGNCPRHDPDMYEPSPYIELPDPDCHEAANRIEALDAKLAVAREALEKVARQRTDLSGDFSLGSRQSDIARQALKELDND